jgi:hypothetical protein
LQCLLSGQCGQEMLATSISLDDRNPRFAARAMPFG